MSDKTVANVLMSRLYNDVSISMRTNEFEMLELEGRFPEPYSDFVYSLEFIPVEFEDFADYQIENDGNLYDMHMTVNNALENRSFSCFTRVYIQDEDNEE